MEEHLLFLHSNVVNVEDVCNFTLLGPNSTIISDRCDYVETQICTLLGFGFPHIFL